MFVDEKFRIRHTGLKVEANTSTSMSIGPENEWTKEEERVSIVISPLEYEDKRRLWIKMSRKEALTLGVKLVEYGTRKLEGETA